MPGSRRPHTLPSPDDPQLRLWSVLAAVPAGRVVTYGQLAELSGLAGQARRVGTLLSQLPESTTLPWHRVINASGRISFPQGSPAYLRQKQRLEAEGVLVNQGRIPLREYRWIP